jgi:hypothetical protein
MNRPRPHATRLAAAAVAALAFAQIAGGCGGAASYGGADSPAAGKEAPGAIDELTQYEREIALALGEPMPQGAYAQPPGLSQQQSGQYPSPTATMPPPPPNSPPNDTMTKPSEGEAKRAEASAEPAQTDATPVMADPCAIACRALASMGRSAEHICDLAGTNDERCSHARDRVRNAEDRVRQRCPACPG